MEYAISEQMRAWGKAHGFNVDEYCDAFNDYLSNRSRKPYKDLDAAFRNCVRSDWFNLRRNARINAAYTKPAPAPQSRILKTVNGPMAWENGGWVMAND